MIHEVAGPKKGALKKDNNIGSCETMNPRLRAGLEIIGRIMGVIGECMSEG